MKPITFSDMKPDSISFLLEVIAPMASEIEAKKEAAKKATEKKGA